MSMTVTTHGPVLKRSVPFYCCKVQGAAFFGENRRELMRRADEWLLTHRSVSEPRPVTKPLLRLVHSH